MKRILIIGAGRSATSLINYLLQAAPQHNWQIRLADFNLELAQQKVKNSTHAEAVQLDIMDVEARRNYIEAAEVVVSMLPAHLHIEVAKDCLRYKKHLATASFVSSALAEMHEEVQKEGLIFMNELGLDPGLDHMSAMKTIHEIHEAGGHISSFKSFTGGLVAPENDTNPWHYKFSWNPRNVVLAGQGTAQYLFENTYKYIPYHRLFTTAEDMDIQDMGVYEGYANRDSLHYRSLYNLEDTSTILRGTLRHKGYSRAWNIFVQLGLTNDTYQVVDLHKLTYRTFLEAHLPADTSGASTRTRLAEFMGMAQDDEALDKVEWLGLFEDTPIPQTKATPAQVLQQLLEGRWKLEPQDKDMIIMQHEFVYTLPETETPKTHISTLVSKGEDAMNTAMARLVGLPLGIFVKHLMLGHVEQYGVHIPTHPEVYGPILQELEGMDVHFKEMIR